MFNFYETPRAFGNPNQTIVKSPDELHRLISMNYGKFPEFISHNSYPSVTKNQGGFEEPAQVNVSKFFFDFDADRKPENAQLDAIKVLDFADEENLPVLPVFSGSKGFHTYLALEPTVYNYGTFLKDATRAVHIWMKQTLGLRTIDLQCAEPRRLCRIFYTPHVKRDKKKNEMYANGMYCTPMRQDWVRDWKIDQIMRYATHPEQINYTPKGDLLTLDQFLDRFDINIERTLATKIDDGETKRNSLVEYIPVNNDYIKSILPHPCVHSQIVNNPNPPHYARFAAATWFREIGLDRGVAFKFFEKMNYVDYKPDVTAAQINNIYDHNYKFPTCKKLYENALCVGKECAKFKRFAEFEKIEY
jgi:hypothetical protein